MKHKKLQRKSTDDSEPKEKENQSEMRTTTANDDTPETSSAHAHEDDVIDHEGHSVSDVAASTTDCEEIDVVDTDIDKSEKESI